MAFGCGGANSTRFLIFFQPPVRCTVIRLKLKAQKAHKEHHSLQNLCCIIHWGFGASDLESRRLSTCAKSWARTSRRLWMSTWRHRPSTSFAKSPSLLRSTVRSIPPLTDHTLYFRAGKGPAGRDVGCHRIGETKTRTCSRPQRSFQATFPPQKECL
jgi:hypothetical protein